MEPRANPIPKRGERNICCPFYNDCLDQAVEGSWQSWDCSQWLIKVKGSALGSSLLLAHVNSISVPGNSQ